MATDYTSLEDFMNPEWMRDAKCKGTPPDSFFIEDLEVGSNKKQYKEICAGCPVVGECLDYALIFDLVGVWGGLTDRDRRIRYPEGSRQELRQDYFAS